MKTTHDMFFSGHVSGPCTVEYDSETDKFTIAIDPAQVMMNVTGAVIPRMPENVNKEHVLRTAFKAVCAFIAAKPQDKPAQDAPTVNVRTLN